MPSFFIALLHALVLLLLPVHTPFVSAMWVNDTASFLGDSDVYLRITSQADLDDATQTGFVGTWANRTNLVWYCRKGPHEGVHSGNDNMWRRREGKDHVYSLCWSSVEFPALIVSTVVVDLNRDGKLDIIAQCEDGSLYFISGRHRNDPPVMITRGNISLLHPYMPQMSVVHVFSTCGLPEIAVVDITGSLIVMQATTEMTSGSACRGEDVVPSFTPVVLVEGKKNVREVVPLSIISDDMDGDCVADLLYTVYEKENNTLQVYVFFPTHSKHELVLSLHTAGKYGFPVMADINGDGAPDIIFPVCAAMNVSEVPFGECTQYNGLVVFYNDLQGSPPCSGAGCCMGYTYGFNNKLSKEFFIDEEEEKGKKKKKENNDNVCGIHPSKEFPLVMPSSPTSPLLIRTGDYTRDGYVDLIVPSTYGPLLLMSQANWRSNAPFTCEPLDGTHVRRGMQVSTSSVSDAVYSMYTDAIPFFSIISDYGVLDVVLTYHHSNNNNNNNNSHNSHGAIPVAVYTNHIPHLRENYFLGSDALSNPSEEKQNEEKENPRDWGVPQSGTVHRFGWSDLDMRPRWAYAAQMSRSQGHALQPPRVLFGLGHTFSYVHDYAVGMQANRCALVHRWSANLVPNSNVFAALSPPLAPGDWRLRLYVVAATYQRLLLVVLATALALIGVPIIFLKSREVRQDRREWRFR